MSKNIMINLLKEIDSYPKLSAAFGILSDNEKAKFLTAMKTMKRDKLYESPIHGEYHSEKVTLFCLLLGVMLGCSDKELDILIDAGMYHDFMRELDNEDTLHGFSSAIHIENVIDKNKYTPTELNILKSIIDYHSADIKMHTYNYLAENYDLSGEALERGKILANILRDADALDRCRFSKDSPAALKPQLLTYSESLGLIGLSEEINNAYLGKMFTNEEILRNPYLYKNVSTCFHSIGKNMFRLNSVLNNGLLSHSRLCQIDSSFHRNFDGGNCDKWISVVPCNKFDREEGASKEFLRHGIVFLFDKVDLYYPDEKVTSSYARSYGIPYTKNRGYVDEQYAFDYIPKEKIVGIMLDKTLAGKDLCDLQHYVYDSFSYELFESNVKSYLDRLGLLKDGEMPLEIKDYMDKYRIIDEEMADNFENKNIMLQDLYAERLLVISSKINRYIGRQLHEYYRKKLNLAEGSTITIKDAVLYELSISNYDYVQLPDDNIFYLVTPKVEVKNKDNYL